MQVYLNKVLSLLLVLTSVIVYDANAQTDEAKRSFFNPSNSFGVAVGIQKVRPYQDISYSPALILQYEHFTMNTLGPGFLSIGVEYGVYRFKMPFSPRDYHYKMAFAVRGIYHLAILKSTSETVGLYGGIAAGLYSSSEWERRWQADPYNPVFLSPFVGVKYNPSVSGVGLWAEGGTDITYLKLGLNFNF
jgi:hypothetical protein